jgi:hypothetical protein
MNIIDVARHQPQNLARLVDTTEYIRSTVDSIEGVDKFKSDLPKREADQSTGSALRTAAIAPKRPPPVALPTTPSLSPIWRKFPLASLGFFM